MEETKARRLDVRRMEAFARRHGERLLAALREVPKEMGTDSREGAKAQRRNPMRENEAAKISPVDKQRYFKSRKRTSQRIL